MSGKNALLATLLTGALSVAGCQTVQTTAPGAVGIERKQQMLISESDIEKGAAQAYAQQVQKARQAGKLNTDAALTARVRTVSQRLIPQTRAFRPDAPGWKWEVNTLTTKEMNAYAMPGGKIMVYSGLVERLTLTDAELAAVIGHEISHALREHTRERVSRAYAQQIALTGIAVATGAGQGTLDLANSVAAVTFQLPHSREQESEADIMGLELMARAGYDPNAAVNVWKKMMAAEKSNPPEFLSTHPSPGNRIAELEASVPKVLPLYQSARR
ncbi:MAG TPA: M48 family metallopeptidase [Longimicrobiales bacterium]|nr:M48 family metallopeptidase [Longimicrobiales bacterium]